MRILFTNNSLAERGGSETFLFDVAVALAARGHSVMAYSTRLGAVSSELIRHGVSVTDRLDTIQEPPDIIHGQHHEPTLDAITRFPSTPAIYVCHGAVPAEERPPCHPNIRQYVAVDEPCRERIASEAGAEAIVIPNAVDLTRFERRSPLPAMPVRALFFGNAQPTGVLHAACAVRGIAFSTMGGRNSCDQPWNALPIYDVVFARGRCALEAMAVGAAVILVTESHLGGIVTARDLDYLRRYNFGYRLCVEPLSLDGIHRQLDRYDQADAATVTDRVREFADLSILVDRLEAVYKKVVGEKNSSPPSRTASPWL